MMHLAADALILCVEGDGGRAYENSGHGREELEEKVAESMRPHIDFCRSCPAFTAMK